MTDPFKASIYQKGDDPEYFEQTYETDTYESVSDAIQDACYEISSQDINYSEEQTHVIIEETKD